MRKSMEVDEEVDEEVDKEVDAGGQDCQKTKWDAVEFKT